MRVKFGLVLICLALSPLLPGCVGSGPSPSEIISATQSTTPTAYVPQGWVLYHRPADGFALALPPDFKVYDVTPENIDKIIAEVKNTDQQVTQILEWVKAQPTEPGTSVVFYALDISKQSRASGFMGNVILVKDFHKSQVSLDDYVQGAMKANDKNSSIQKPVRYGRIRTSNGEFEELHYNSNIPNYPKVMASSVLLGVNGNVAYTLSLGTTTDQMDKYGPLFDEIAQTFRLE